MARLSRQRSSIDRCPYLSFNLICYHDICIPHVPAQCIFIRSIEMSRNVNDKLKQAFFTQTQVEILLSIELILLVLCRDRLSLPENLSMIFHLFWKQSHKQVRISSSCFSLSLSRKTQINMNIINIYSNRIKSLPLMNINMKLII